MVKCSRSSRISNGTSMRRRTAGFDSIEGDLETGDGVGTHAASFTSLPLARPVPRQEFVEPVDIVIVDAPEHIGKPSSRIDIVDLGRL